MAVWRGYSWFVRGLLSLIVLLVLAVIAIYLWLRSAQPQRDGALVLPGLRAEARVTRDRWDIPHIAAANLHDAFFTLGFVQAQDRLFQMDMLRRYGEGRIAELAGRNSVALDRFMRTIGLYQSAREELTAISPATRRALDWYAQGVNAYIAHHAAGEQPYYLFLPGPAPWRAVDTLVIEKIMAFYLAQNYRREIEHARIAKRLTPAELHDLYPGYPKNGFVTLAALQAIYRRLPLDRLAALLPRASAQPNASNNWVLDGRHSATGKPILENDPHLSYTAPAIWYLAQVKAPGMSLAGAMIPGEPFIVVGHNAHIGWGFTETGGDVEDLFVEKTDPARPNQYLTPQGWRPFATRHETIHVKGEPDIPLTVRSTRHGPVISDIDAGAKAATPAGDYALALEATFLQPGDKTAQAIWGMNRARNWDEFKRALRDFVAPQMNIVYADTGGTIGFIAPAYIPIRKKGYGWLPEPGWTGAYDWVGFIPFDGLPQAQDPPDGRFISANNKIVPDGYPYFITRDWAPPYRADRIAALLDRRRVQTLQSTGAIAADTVSLMARHMLPLLLRAPPGDRRSAAAERILRRWNGDMRPDMAAPLIFVAWLRETERELFAERLGSAFADYGRHFHPRAVATVMSEDPRWCAVAADREKPDCSALTAHALAVSLADLTKRFGDDMTDWRWGMAHQAYFRNYVIEHIPALDWFFRIMAPAGGGSYTVDAGDMDLGDVRHPYRDVTGPGMRMILDFADLSQSRFLMAPGVSEDPFSPHYRDLLAGWKNFDWIVLDHAQRAATLTLQPQHPKNSSQ